jgi:hypothetical protein
MRKTIRAAIEKSISVEPSATASAQVVQQALVAADAIPTYHCVDMLADGDAFIWQVDGNWQLAAATAG